MFQKSNRENKTNKTIDIIDWHHQGTRQIAAWVFTHAIGPRIGMSYDPKVQERNKKNGENALAELEKNFLADSPFILSDTISIADISAFEEVIQMDLLIPQFSMSEKYPKISAWQKKVKSQPFYDEIHNVLEKVVAAGQKKAKETASAKL